MIFIKPFATLPRWHLSPTVLDFDLSFPQQSRQCETVFGFAHGEPPVLQSRPIVSVFDWVGAFFARVGFRSPDRCSCV